MGEPAPLITSASVGDDEYVGEKANPLFWDGVETGISNDTHGVFNWGGDPSRLDPAQDLPVWIIRTYMKPQLPYQTPFAISAEKTAGIDRFIFATNDNTFFKEPD